MIDVFDKNKFEEEVKLLLQSLNIPFSEKNIYNYMLVFVHRSVINEDITDFQEHNERLEFFGDAFLELAITECLYLKFPEKNEGDLTDLRSSIVRGNNLAKVADSLNLGKYLLLSKGEQQSRGNKNPYLLANTMEAFLGALYIDLGYDFSLNFVKKYIFSGLDDILSEGLHIDPKSKVQEYYQRELSITPSYSVINETGPDHDKIYEVELIAGDDSVEKGEGKSKKKAEEDAARNFLTKIGII